MKKLLVKKGITYIWKFIGKKETMNIKKMDEYILIGIEILPNIRDNHAFIFISMNMNCMNINNHCCVF